MEKSRNIAKYTKDDLINLKKRRMIYQFILKNQGIHFREIARKINIPRSTLSYHLNYLEKQELLIVKKDDKYTRYYISKNLGYKEKKILDIIRIDTTRNILLYIMFMISASQIEIAEELDKHPTTITYHLKRLIKYSIIEPAPIVDGIIYTSLSNIPLIKREKSKNEIFYRLKEPEIIEKLLIIYYEKGYYNDKIAEAIFSYPEYAIPRGTIVKTKKEKIEHFEKIIYDVFPHPYYI